MISNVEHLNVNPLKFLSVYIPNCIRYKKLYKCPFNRGYRVFILLVITLVRSKTLFCGLTHKMSFFYYNPHFSRIYKRNFLFYRNFLITFLMKVHNQRKITQNITKEKKVEFVEIRTQNTITALLDGRIDAGVWNYDDVIDNNQKDFKVVFLDDSDYNNLFSTAVLVVRKQEEYLIELLKKHIRPERVLTILQEVREGRRLPNY